MLRSAGILILGCLTLVGGSARAQAPSAPLHINPAAAPPPAASGAAHAAVPSNWKIVDAGRDPVTERPMRMAITLPKSDSAKNGRSGATGLAIICFSANPNIPTHPELALVFTAVTGVGRYKKFAARYRFDEGPIYNPTLTSDVGKNGTRRFILPTSSDPSPATEITGASQFRAEVNLHSAGIVFLDFNVAGAAAAIKAIACQ